MSATPLASVGLISPSHADHVPPAGYVRLSVNEFNELFKDAEIQYVPASGALPDGRPVAPSVGHEQPEVAPAESAVSVATQQATPASVAAAAAE